MVQRFVREHRLTRQKTVAKDVVDFLDGCGFIIMELDSKTSIESCLHFVCRFLNHLGYKRRKKKGMMNYALKEENIQKRDACVQFMTELNKGCSRRIVFLDESYIHKNYQQHNDSLFDPNNEQELEVKAQHKPKLHCLLLPLLVRIVDWRL